MSLLSFYPQLTLVRDAFTTCPNKIYLVGGALRDYFIDRRGQDFDFAVDKGALDLARLLARKIKGTFVALDTIHGSGRVVKKMQGDVFTFDLTDWRAATIRKDLLLRDFTINTLAVDMGSDLSLSSIIEVKGARHDLKTGRICMVSSGAFHDDPLRLLRGLTLAATLGFNIEKNTLVRMTKDAPLIVQAAMERKREEIFKILASPRAYETLVCMDSMGLLACILPQLTVMKGIPQGGYHHLDVWAHTLETVAQLEKILAAMNDNEQLRVYFNEIIGGGHTRLALLKMAALLHDIGKPETSRQEDKRITFHGHEHAGARITRVVAKQLKLSVKERYFLEDAVVMHLRPGYLSNFKDPSPKAIFRYLRDTGDEAASLAVLALADQAATCGVLTQADKHTHHAQICHRLIQQYFTRQEQAPKQRLLTGVDLIKVLKLKPSPLFGDILSRVEEAAALEKIKTRAQALAFARKLVKK